MDEKELNSIYERFHNSIFAAEDIHLLFSCLDEIKTLKGKNRTLPDKKIDDVKYSVSVKNYGNPLCPACPPWGNVEVHIIGQERHKERLSHAVSEAAAELETNSDKVCVPHSLQATINFLGSGIYKPRKEDIGGNRYAFYDNFNVSNAYACLAVLRYEVNQERVMENFKKYHDKRLEGLRKSLSELESKLKGASLSQLKEEIKKLKKGL